MRNRKRKFLVSVDDGSQYDLGVGDLLLKYKIPAVFYIPPKVCELSEAQIKRLSGIGTCPLCKTMRELFEIGAHTLTHPEDLKRLEDNELVEEIAGSKALLERIVKKPVTKFCYPGGKFNDRVKEVVERVGFKEARTTNILCIEFPKDPFETNPTIHVHPDRKEYKERTWIEWAYELFDKVLQEGGRFELFCHGWEVEKYNQWEFLDDFLWYMSEGLKKINYPRKI